MSETTPPPSGPYLTLSQVVAEQLPKVRAGKPYLRRQEDIAFRMQTWLGAPWTRATVAAIETGKREIRFDELLALSFACDVRLSDWFVGEGWVLITPGTSVTRKGIRSMLGSGEVADTPEKEADLYGYRFGASHEDKIMSVLSRDILRRVWPTDDPPAVKDPNAATLDAKKAVEQKAAARLGVDPLELSMLAHALWSHGLTEERDLRVLAEAPANAGESKLKALRGHVTRALLQELTAAMTGDADE